MDPVNFISFSEYLENQAAVYDKKLAVLPFFFDGKPLPQGHAQWGMTTLKAGTMRFRWNEENEGRKILSDTFGENRFCPLHLIHSKIIYTIEKPEDLKEKEGDGVLTSNMNLIPTVTVADCVPILIYDKENKIICALHSGWKGTGICKEAVLYMEKKFGCKIENLCAAIGPHIESCYYVDDERADYFIKNFGPECIKREGDKNLLSLLNANLQVLKETGFNFKNIVAAKECTCSSKNDNGEYIFGSCRRQTEGISGLSPEEFSKKFTVQAAFIGMI